MPTSLGVAVAPRTDKFIKNGLERGENSLCLGSVNELSENALQN